MKETKSIVLSDKETTALFTAQALIERMSLGISLSDGYRDDLKEALEKAKSGIKSVIGMCGSKIELDFRDIKFDEED